MWVHRNADEAATAGEHAGAKVGRTGGDGNARQAGTVLKRGGTDIDKIRFQSDLGQAATFGKGSAAEVGHAVGDE